MAFCVKCGQKVEEGTRFCPVCGTPLHMAATQPREKSSGEPVTRANEADERWRRPGNMADATTDFDQRDIEQNKVMAILAYFGFLVIIPILGAKESRFARYHANQGLILFIALVGWGIIDYVLTSVLWSLLWRGAGLWGTYSTCSLALNLVYIVFTVLAVMGMVNAVNGKAKELPVIGKFKILK